MNRKIFKKVLHTQISQGNYLLGIGTATGMSALYGKQAGADFIMVLNSGKFRQMGRSSLGGYLAFNNSNELVKELSDKEILPIIDGFPAIFGVNATDPLLNKKALFEYLKQRQFLGVVNYPTICLIDGQFREGLEEEGICFQDEVDFLTEAHHKDLFTIAFVSNKEEAQQMSEIPADIICIHLGLTQGGQLGGKRVKSFEAMLKNVTAICEMLDSNQSSSLVMIYGGILNDLTEVRYVYNQIPKICGYIGGSTFERIGSEQLLVEQTRAFKRAELTKNDNLTLQMLEGIEKYYDYVDFVKKYIEENYSIPIYISELAEITHLHPSYLSDLFKKKTGVNFTEYLIRFRLNKAIELMKSSHLKLHEIAFMVGYPDYALFNKVFRRHVGMSPRAYRKSNISTN